MEVAPAGEVDC